MRRGAVAAAVLGALVLGLGLDLADGAVPNPYRAPALLAVGSGEAAGAAFCAAPPPPAR